MNTTITLLPALQMLNPAGVKAAGTDAGDAAAASFPEDMLKALLTGWQAVDPDQPLLDPGMGDAVRDKFKEAVLDRLSDDASQAVQLQPAMAIQIQPLVQPAQDLQLAPAGDAPGLVLSLAVAADTSARHALPGNDMPGVILNQTVATASDEPAALPPVAVPDAEVAESIPGSLIEAPKPLAAGQEMAIKTTLEGQIIQAQPPRSAAEPWITPQRQEAAAKSADFAVSMAPVAGEKNKNAVPELSDTPPQQQAAASIPLPIPANAAAPAARPADALPNPAILPAVNSVAWGSHLGEKIVWAIGQQQQGIELRLTPPALGPLEIRVSVSDGQANLSFMTQHLPVREAIEAATPRLREMLGESGLTLGSISVDIGTFSQQLPGSQGSRHSGAPFADWQASGMLGIPASDAAMQIRQLHASSIVDIFA